MPNNLEKTSDKSLLQAKHDIISVVDGLDESNYKDINVCFFNAKYYENYIYKSSYYNSPEKLILYENKEYKKMQEQRWKGLIDKIRGGTFNKYLKEQLKDNPDLLDGYEGEKKKDSSEESSGHCKKYRKRHTMIHEINRWSKKF